MQTVNSDQQEQPNLSELLRSGYVICVYLNMAVFLDVMLNHRCSSGVALASRTGNLSTSEILTPTTPTSSSQSRLCGSSTPHFISGLAAGRGIEGGKSNGGLLGLLGPPPKLERGRKKIKAENGSSLLVVPYPILASGNDQPCVGISAKEGKTYRQDHLSSLIISTAEKTCKPTGCVFSSVP